MQDWQPSTTRNVLKIRARIFTAIRAFFEERGVLEVETPALSDAGTTDLHIASLRARYTGPGAAAGRDLWLHTSPEFAMKRLLAAGSGPIYQICKVFRDGECGRLHNPEFTLLEWYRPGLSLDALMDEVAEVAQVALAVVGRPRLPVRKQTYRNAFIHACGIDPWVLDEKIAREALAARGMEPPAGLPADDPDTWRDLVLTHLVEPGLGRGCLEFIHDYPASQAALARIVPGPSPGHPPVAARFELYFEGMELANGFDELSDAAELRGRFEQDNRRRARRNLPEMPVDGRFLSALEAGLPECTGVALGFDRLILGVLGGTDLRNVIAFPLC